MKSIFVEVSIPRILAVWTLQRAWKNVVFSPLSPLHYRDLPTPSLPGRDWVLVRPRLSGICGSDLHIVEARASLDAAPLALPSNQHLFLGHEVAGVVCETGSRAGRFKPGDRVGLRIIDANCWVKTIEPPCAACAAGNYSICENLSVAEERLPRNRGAGWSECFAAHESQLYGAPPDFGDEQLVLLEPAACALHAVLRRCPLPESRALVVGAGMIGLCTVMAIKHLEPSCNVTAVARHAFQADLIREAGADTVVLENEANERIPQIVDARLYRGTGGAWMLLGGFDTVFDCVGSDRSITASLRWTKCRGAVVIVGVNLRPGRIDYTPVWYQEVDLIGCIGHGAEPAIDGSCSTFELAVDMIRRSPFDLRRVITHRFALADYREAIVTARDKNRSKAVKVVFDFRSDPAAAGAVA